MRTPMLTIHPARYSVLTPYHLRRLGSLSSDELIIYEHIEAAGREGIWTKVLKTRTNQHQTVMTKCLKSLESRRFIKCIKSVKVGNQYW